jgi:aromatic ring-opening dioxygenase LigB subunit
MPVLNVQQLAQPELKKLAKVYDSLKNKELQAIAKLDQDKVRQAIDDAFSEVLNLPNLSTLRELLAREPGLSGKGLYVPVAYPPTQKKSKIAK